jgi:uncharacterized membrane protein HdeD (DUF308 family)
MVREVKVHTTVLIIQGVLMIGLGLSLFWLGKTITDVFSEIAGCIVAVLLTAAFLLLLGVIDCIGGLTIRKGHRRELHFYLFLGATSMALGLILWFSPWGSVQVLAVLAGLQGLFWAMWDLRFSSHLSDHPRERNGLRVLGVTTLALGLALITGMELRSQLALLLLASYVTYIGIQILMVGFYIYRHWNYVTDSRTGAERLIGEKPV